MTVRGRSRDLRTPGRGRDDRGSSLIPAIFLTVLFCGMAAALLAPIPSLLQATSARIARAAARYEAIGAAAYAVHRLALGGQSSGSIVVAGGDLEHGAAAPQGRARTAAIADLGLAPDGSFIVSITPLADGTNLLEAYAKSMGVIESMSEVVAPVPVGPYLGSAFGVHGISLACVFSDSYDSSKGAYASQATAVDPRTGLRYAGAAGTIASNGSISLGGGAVFGDVVAGPSGILSPAGTAIVGSTTPATGARAVEPVPYSPPATDDSALLAPLAGGSLAQAAGILDLPTGAYVLSSFLVSGGTVNVRGDVTLYVSQRFRTEETGTVIIHPGASLTIHVAGAFELAGGGIQNRTGPTVLDPATKRTVTEGLPERLQVLAARGPTGLDPALRFATATRFYGVVDAPTRCIDLATSLEAFGAFVVDGFTGTAAARLHFDERLLRGIGSPAGGLASYRVLARWSRAGVPVAASPTVEPTPAFAASSPNTADSLAKGCSR